MQKLKIWRPIQVRQRMGLETITPVPEMCTQIDVVGPVLPGEANHLQPRGLPLKVSHFPSNPSSTDCGLDSKSRVLPFFPIKPISSSSLKMLPYRLIQKTRLCSTALMKFQAMKTRSMVVSLRSLTTSSGPSTAAMPLWSVFKCQQPIANTCV